MSDGANRVDRDSAERIVRTLMGVVDVSIDPDGRGSIARVRVSTEPGAVQRDIALNVASALRATFGIDLPTEAVLMGPIANGASRVPEPPAAPPEPSKNGSSANGKRPHATHATVAPALALESADLARISGRVRCRVVLAAGPDRWTGAGDAPDLPGEELRLTARVTVDALRAARAAADPIQVDDVTLAQIAGRTHAVVALRIWQGEEGRVTYGVQAVLESNESAAALAVMHAALGAK